MVVRPAKRRVVRILCTLPLNEGLIFRVLTDVFGDIPALRYNLQVLRPRVIEAGLHNLSRKTATPQGGWRQRMRESDGAR
jgi:hypothetical protein